MATIDIEDIKKRSVSGVVALTARTFLLQAIAFGATFLLTLFLTPEIFGYFYVVSAIISFLGYFSDVGLAAALVQKHDEVTDEDLGTTFVIQQGLVMTLVVLSLLSAEWVGKFYGFDANGVWLFRALAVSFFLSSLKTIPSVLLERKLSFDKLVIPQVVETLGFYIVAVVLAWKGFGIRSFTWAVLTRGLLGLITIYIVEPWMPRMTFSRASASRLMRFGLPFQLNSFLALLKDDLLTVYLGKVLPFSAVGYIGWAKKWAEVPLRLIMDSVIRVTFPAYSRLQHDTRLLVKAIDKTLFGLAALILPISTGLLFFMHPIINSIPKYAKWEPALMSFYVFVFSSAIAAMTTPLMNALNAVGRIKTTLKFMVAWTTLTWIFTTVMIRIFGFTGVSISMLLISFTIYFVIRKAKDVASFNFVENVRSALIASVVQGCAYWFMVPLLPKGILWVIVGGSVGLILYGGAMYVLEMQRIAEFVASLKRSRS